ncbi:FtsX-like permease family protein [Segetibacter sp. 3557_3]|uniref:ABC transporter permease n=1 Tax=Segetibacter sp. 3557_3 TaxID=2547429 RepID=UPI0010586424|nr:FtsX-like permease family protein [Segetibacter sp. 3557_3]TDH27934.1 FtsX-like permease family protein [Segetibacter sp. 3557_3]
MQKSNGLNLPWLFKMAWRDSRRNRSRLLLFISSIILGIGALVAIYSLGDNVRRDIDQQAASLLGADLEITANKQVTGPIKKMLDSLGDRRSREESFASMIFFPKNSGTRLVQVKAIDGEFPYYGSLETEPAQAGKAFRDTQAAVVDRTLMLQYNAQPGDSVKIGKVTFVIAGTLLKAPGQTGLSASVAPTVYIPLRFMKQTGLQQTGSRINYKFYYKYDQATNMNALIERLEPRLNHYSLSFDTIESQKEDTGRSFSDLNSFLSLVGFIALLLGCIGVASAIHIYIKEKIPSIAVIRCLGVKARQAFLIYLIQIAGIGLIGAVIGAALGTLIQQFLPFVLRDFIAVDITTGISWRAVTQGIILGLVISVLFALLPLISLRRISPLNTLRISANDNQLARDPAKWLVYLLIVGFIVAFSYLQLKSIERALFFTAGVITAFLVLTAMAYLVMWTVRRFFPVSWSYLWRQGLANLYRPNNQTIILLVSIGLGTAFICTLFAVQTLVLKRVTLSASGNQPTMVLFDIQKTQKEPLITLARQHALPIIQEVPIVNMRLEQYNGKTAATISGDSSFSRRAFTREYRVTYRDSLTESEKITKGEWHGSATADNGTVYVSLEQGFARRQHISIGDTMVFNVQGSLVPTIVGSFREVDWNRIQTNFLVVFPKGVLEQAPQFFVLLTRVATEQASARFQQAVVQNFPNISIIDLGLVIKTLDEILSKIGFVIRFMAAFSIITGLVVLIASVLISKYQRIQESVLLRTLGASRKQILFITALEYFFLGALAAATGILLSLIGSWLLAEYLFKTSYTPEWLPLLVIFLAIALLTMFIGLFNSRGILSKPPLEILRQES